ncbi:MAG: phosphodiesterase [Armatimonadetes bacterium]|nr:phosphodiesterase [Armatimonadota bacterium]
MRIGIIADTHGNLEGWQQAWEVALEGSDLVLHAGDVLYHGPKFDPAEAYSPKTLAAALNDCPVPLIIARGNGDSDVDQLVLDMPVQSPYAFVQFEGLRILVAHGHIAAPEELAPLAARWGVELLVTGHTHCPALQRLDGVLHVNPGTVTYPLSKDPALERRTCAVYEDGEVTHFDVETGEVVTVVTPG